MKKPHTKKGTTRFWADKEEKISLSGFSVGTDWMLLVGLFTLLFAGLLFWSWSTYRNVVEESYLKDSVQAESRTRVNEEQLNRVLSNFEERRSRFEDLSGGFTFTFCCLWVHLWSLF